MKRLLLTFCLFAMAVCAMAQKVDLGKVVVDKDNCTITNKATGKTFNLYGRVEIVDHSPDFRVEIVDHSPDIYVMAHHRAGSCGEYVLVDHSPDIRIEIVDHSPDFRVEIRDSHPRINH